MSNDKKHHVFLYDRKEIYVLVLLGIMIAVFAFTLGVHLGKKVGGKEGAAHLQDHAAIETSQDELPNRVEIAEQSRGVNEATDQALNRALHDEVAKTGIKLEEYRQTELPDQSKTPVAGATTLESAQKKSNTTLKQEAPVGQYTLQIGSYPTLEEAAKVASSLEALGIKTFFRNVEIPSKGKWFRIYSGGFKTQNEAESAGERYKKQHVIDSFIVAPIPKL